MGWAVTQIYLQAPGTATSFSLCFGLYSIGPGMLHSDQLLAAPIILVSKKLFPNLNVRFATISSHRSVFTQQIWSAFPNCFDQYSPTAESNPKHPLTGLNYTALEPHQPPTIYSDTQ